MRRSAISVPGNIAEGAARGSRKDFIRFLHIAQGSLAELETQTLLARDLGFTNDDEIDKGIDQVGRMLTGLIKALKK